MVCFKFFHKAVFKARGIPKKFIYSRLRKLYWQAQGAKFGKDTFLPHLKITWPHQLQIGDNCLLEEDIFFKFDGPWKPGPSIIICDRVFIGSGCEFNISKGISIGIDCLIASGCKFIDHDHGMSSLDQPMNQQQGSESLITLERDVWLGANVIILKGVYIGKSSVVGAGSVVTKSIPENEIWSGVPAKKLRTRERHL